MGIWPCDVDRHGVARSGIVHVVLRKFIVGNFKATPIPTAVKTFDTPLVIFPIFWGSFGSRKQSEFGHASSRKRAIQLRRALCPIVVRYRAVVSELIACEQHRLRREGCKSSPPKSGHGSYKQYNK